MSWPRLCRLPLALTAAKAGFRVLGFDIDGPRVDQINRGESFIKHIPSDVIGEAVKSGQFSATAGFDRISEADAILICVPTPLTKHREPDLSFVEQTARAIAPRARARQLVVLEVDNLPRHNGRDHQADSRSDGPEERRRHFHRLLRPSAKILATPTSAQARSPKVVGGDVRRRLRLRKRYGALVVRTVPVSSTATAEAVKLTENIFRAVNIALVNELKVVYTAMGIDVWEVIEAAKSKPFGFMPFYPGPGLGGHCIPIDPFYLTWKAREHEITTRFIELAGEVNTRMPGYVVERLLEAIDRHAGKGAGAARILLLGMAYKKNVDDIRESPSLKLIELIEKRGARVDYHDPYVAVIPNTREHADLAGRRSVALTPGETLKSYDGPYLDGPRSVDYRQVVDNAQVVVDTRVTPAGAPESWRERDQSVTEAVERLLARSRNRSSRLREKLHEQ